MKTIIQNWQNVWSNRAYKRSFILATTALAFMFIFTYFFLGYNETRSGGVVLNDWVLSKIPAKDVSVPITFLITSVMLLFIVRSIANPIMVITFVIAFTFILISRVITISITQLNPPPGLIALKDPVCNIMYQSRFITKDLFYSGHTATLFLFYLCSFKKPDKYYMLFATITVGFLLLVQHVHYIVDVINAPLFAFGCFWLSKNILAHRHNYITCLY